MVSVMRRCAILLDELEDERESAPYLTAMPAAATSMDCGGQLAPQLDLSLMGRHVVVELKTANALPLLKYACSSRIMALPTSQLNAQRVSVQQTQQVSRTELKASTASCLAAACATRSQLSHHTLW
jgi:hypothetical protein